MSQATYPSSLDLPAGRIATFCKDLGIARLSLFGSALRDDFRPDSDLDLLVEFLPGSGASLLDMAAMESELSTLVGRKVDLRTPAELSRYFRDDVLRHCERLYAAPG